MLASVSRVRVRAGAACRAGREIVLYGSGSCEVTVFFGSHRARDVLVCGLMAVGSTLAGAHLGLNAHGQSGMYTRNDFRMCDNRHRMVSCCSCRKRWIGLTARRSRMGLCCASFTKALDCDSPLVRRERALNCMFETVLSGTSSWGVCMVEAV